MTTVDAGRARCEVLTFKEGLLSAVGHDLILDVARLTFRVDAQGPSVEATVDPTSLRVRTAVVDGTPRPDALSPRDRRSIEQHIVDDVLAASRYPTIRFTSTSVEAEGATFRLSGMLELHGQRREVQAWARPEGDTLVAELTLHQPDWGIVPFTAMLGTLRVRADVRVRVILPVVR